MDFLHPCGDNSLTSRTFCSSEEEQVKDVEITESNPQEGSKMPLKSALLTTPRIPIKHGIRKHVSWAREGQLAMYVMVDCNVGERVNVARRRHRHRRHRNMGEDIEKVRRSKHKSVEKLKLSTLLSTADVNVSNSSCSMAFESEETNMELVKEDTMLQAPSPTICESPEEPNSSNVSSTSFEYHFITSSVQNVRDTESETEQPSRYWAKRAQSSNPTATESAWKEEVDG